MFEVPTNAQSYAAIRIAHSERARAFSLLPRTLAYPFRAALRMVKTGIGPDLAPRNCWARF